MENFNSSRNASPLNVKAECANQEIYYSIKTTPDYISRIIHYSLIGDFYEHG